MKLNNGKEISLLKKNKKEDSLMKKHCFLPKIIILTKNIFKKLLKPMLGKIATTEKLLLLLELEDSEINFHKYTKSFSND